MLLLSWTEYLNDYIRFTYRTTDLLLFMGLQSTKIKSELKDVYLYSNTRHDPYTVTVDLRSSLSNLVVSVC